MLNDFLSPYGLSMRDLLPHLHDLGVIIQGRSYLLSDIAACVKDPGFQRLFLEALDTTVEKIERNRKAMLVQAAHGRPITLEEHAKLVELLPWYWIMDDIRWATSLHGIHRRHEALANLSEKECMAIRLRYLFDQPDGAIAEIVGLRGGASDEFDCFPFPKHPEVEALLRTSCRTIANMANELYEQERDVLMEQHRIEAEEAGMTVKLDDLRIHQKLRRVFEHNDIIYVHQLTKIRLDDLPTITGVGPAAHRKLVQEMQRHNLHFKR